MEKELRSISLFAGVEITGEDTFLDVGYAKDLDPIGAATTVHSTGAGIRLSFQDRYNMDIAYAKPLDPIGSNLSFPPPERALVTLSARY